MKRLLIVATLAIMAVGCQKTFVQNEVQTPIGFSTEVGKQTRAIVESGDDYSDDQPFAVYAYAYQNGVYKNVVMDNVEVAKNTDWKANDGFTYYWPNDPATKIDFFAFSPYIQRPDSNDEDNVDDGSKAASKANVPHQVMTVTTLSHDKDAGLSFEGYIHSNPYVDFMEATPVNDATFSNPDGGPEGGANLTNGQVPLTFNHKMTQVVFKVTTPKVFPGVKFTVSNIKLKNIKNSGNYSTANNWTATGSGTFQIFPADSDDGATLVNTPTSGTTELDVVLDYTDADVQTPTKSMTTTAVTMIPQKMNKASVPAEPGQDTYETEQTAQMFCITYSIEGKGVATEIVTKHVPFYAYDKQAAVDWTSNMRVVYTVSIGLNEITFMPSVADWADDTDVPVEITPAGN